jgi:hypothetical protein
MSTAIQIVNQQPDMAAIEQVLINGNLAQLNPAQRVSYYNQLCTSLGLNPLTKPFEYLNLQGKLVLYARKDCTEQLRKIHGVSVDEVKTEKFDDVFVVTAKGHDKAGRTDSSTGAVTVGNLKGDALANALMKAETKAKRRFTLSICGLGFLDETEIETIPRHEQFENARNYEVNQSTPAKCEHEGCGKDIVDIDNPQGGKFKKLTALQAIAYSEKNHGASWCWDCISAEKRKQVDDNTPNDASNEVNANKTQDLTKSTTPVEDATPDPLFTTDLTGKLVLQGTVTEIKDGNPLVIAFGKERISTFSKSMKEMLKEAKGKKVIAEYTEVEKGGKTYKNLVEIRRVGDQEYDGGLPVTQLNADLIVNDGDVQG